METCTICLEDIDLNMRLYKMDCCKNYFHRSCIIEWLNKSNTCPICRSVIHNIFYVKINYLKIKKKKIN